MSRSRSGCLTCKRRHRKCDETKPECLQCLGQGMKCAGYNVVLRWDAGIASRRRYITGAPEPSETLHIEHIEPTETTRPMRRTSREPSSEVVSSVELAIPPERDFRGKKGVPQKPIPVVRSPDPEMPSILSEAFQTSLQPPMSSLEGFSWAGWTEQDRDLYERCTSSIQIIVNSRPRTNIFHGLKDFWANKPCQLIKAPSSFYIQLIEMTGSEQIFATSRVTRKPFALFS